MNLLRNEPAEYLATLVKTIAAATIVAGVVGPLVAASYGLTGPMSSGSFAILISVVWLVVGVAYIGPFA